jgi:crotonobetainyl-CoA:carnitine CoA-transferase CaiB-like acyl-CoA transferase
MVCRLREVIATRTLAEWAERFATLAGPWAPVQDTLQASCDAQVRANEYILPAGELELASSPRLAGNLSCPVYRFASVAPVVISAPRGALTRLSDIASSE